MSVIDYAKNKLKMQGLCVIESDVLDIAKRISAHDPMLITVFDPKKEEYQVYDAYSFPKVHIATFADELTPNLIEKVLKASNATSYTFIDKSDDIDYEEYAKEHVQQQSKNELDASISNEIRNADKQTNHFIQRGV